jgi:hypothetical protein
MALFFERYYVKTKQAHVKQASKQSAQRPQKWALLSKSSQISKIIPAIKSKFIFIQ